MHMSVTNISSRPDGFSLRQPYNRTSPVWVKTVGLPSCKLFPTHFINASEFWQLSSPLTHYLTNTKWSNGGDNQAYLLVSIRFELSDWDQGFYKSLVGEGASLKDM